MTTIQKGIYSLIKLVLILLYISHLSGSMMHWYFKD